MSKDLSYFTSELFIYDDLLQKAAAIAEEARNNWRRTQKIEPYAITWPREELATDDGGRVTQAVVCALPLGLTQEALLRLLRAMVDRTRAYGLVLVEERGHELRVLFESVHGARAWLTPLETHGDVVVAGPTQTKNNEVCVGLLWHP